MEGKLPYRRGGPKSILGEAEEEEVEGPVEEEESDKTKVAASLEEEESDKTKVVASLEEEESDKTKVEYSLEDPPKAPKAPNIAPSNQPFCLSS
ncbi:hypothetical protein O181_006204 [Austropuccinia psidii MF-1]|uniref:Uncharacterized protein n=1 Tax=Austropuccinia psidii MF-1 TaxID=1389203 RepID=A0A9Q3BJM7_9BASI|nr:hypothetical protein [Austropuccinia psidii MF-1]